MKGLRLAVALVATLSLVNCAQAIRGLQVGLGILETTHQMIGHVCQAAESVFDSQGVVWGVRFVAAALGESCATGGREINVSATLGAAVDKAKQLRIGQTIEIDGDLAQRDPSAARAAAESLGGPPSMNEPIYARSIRVRQR